MHNNKTDITIKTYNNVVSEYINYYIQTNGSINNVDFKYETDYLANLLPNKSKILDAGTATGHYPKYLTESFNKNFDVIGVDTSKNMLKFATKNSPKAKFKLMDIRKLRFPKESFDAIICFATLNHFNDSECLKILNSFNTLLKPNGYMAINVMEYTSGEKELFIPEPLNKQYMSFFNMYTKQFFIDFFTIHNYKIIKIVDNDNLLEETAGKHLAHTNEFTIIARKNS